MGHWGRSNRSKGTGATVIAMAMAMGHGRRCVCCIAAQKIVVDETVQNVWTANIRDILRSNKTGMMWSGIVFGVSE
jgi:hypothetical protein